MRRFVLLIIAVVLAALLRVHVVEAKPPSNSTRAKFYDFSEQLIDGEIRKPTALYTDSRQKVKFERLLKLKRSFMRELFDTAKEKVFK
tara:strand:- start:102 stop:365 length:264 start_codon:yes stop_codon:yes gene_type:complete